MLLACTGETPEESGETDACGEVTGYAVETSTVPSVLVAGEEATFTLSVQDQDGCPIEDLQESHERMVHTLFISADLTSFQHVHHEDFANLTAADLRTATYHFPITYPLAGDYLAVFDYAHRNAYLQSTERITVTGAPEQAEAPVADYAMVTDAGDVQVALTWETTPMTGFEAAWTVTLTDAAGDVTDLVQWLGADGHAAVVDAALTAPGHTHAWFPDMDRMTPGMPMPPLYPGPTLPYRYTFAEPGLHAMWIQFARADAPEVPYVARFMFDVAP